MQEVLEFLSNYFKNKIRDLKILSICFKNQEPVFPEILPNYFKNKKTVLSKIFSNYILTKTKTKRVREIFSNYFKTRTKIVLEIFSVYFKNQTPEVPEIVLSYVFQKLDTKDSRDSFKLLTSKTKHNIKSRGGLGYLDFFRNFIHY